MSRTARESEILLLMMMAETEAKIYSEGDSMEMIRKSCYQDQQIYSHRTHFATTKP